MTQSVHLIGTEQVQSAANTMMNAAEIMRRSANTIHDSLDRHELMLRDVMQKIDELIEVLEEEHEDDE